MARREILQLGHPLLWEKSAAVDDVTAPAVADLMADLDDTLAAFRAEGDLAELLHHEIDHLEGVLAIQRAVSPQAICTRAEWIRSGRTKKINL